MAGNLATVVHWFGPYLTLKDARQAAVADYDEGLYLAIGRRSTLGPKELLYVGVASNLASRLITKHHKIGELAGERGAAPVGQIEEIWLGEIAVPLRPGRRPKAIEPHVDLVEWMMAFFLRLPGNDKKRRSPPDMSGVVLNRWYSRDDYDRSLEKPVETWADVIEFDGYEHRANLVWFGENGRVEGVRDVMAYCFEPTRTPSP